MALVAVIVVIIIIIIISVDPPALMLLVGASLQNRQHPLTLLVVCTDAIELEKCFAQSSMVLAVGLSDSLSWTSGRTSRKIQLLDK